MEAAVLAAVDVRKRFGALAVLDGVDLTLRKGEVIGIVGPNGADKTTLLSVLSGALTPDGGRVVFDGRDVTGWRADRVTQAGLVRTFQIARGFPRLSVLENLLLYGARQPGEQLGRALLRTPGARRREHALRERAFAIAGRLNLARVVNDAAADLSGGQKKLLELGRALMTEPKLILLDEPIAGVNPTLARELADHLRTLQADGLTFLIIEHHLDLIARLCRPVVVMAEGRHLAEGSFAEVAADPRVQEAYMGRRRWAS